MVDRRIFLKEDWENGKLRCLRRIMIFKFCNCRISIIANFIFFSFFRKK